MPRRTYAIAAKWLPLVLIIGIALFFRLYKLREFYIFEHDQDLYSFIVRDILSGHFRLIGQLTSIEGVFIGPLYYYLLAPFYVLFGYHPLSAYFVATPVAVAVLLSIYYVFYKLFSSKAALIGVFLYASSLPLAFFDRWIVPTQPTILWSVWYLYALFITLKGDRKGLVMFGILAGLIWHIHVALLPLLLLVPVSIFFAKIKYERKYIFWAVGFFVFLTLPFWLFEIRYGFQQIAGLVASIGQDRNGIKGVERFFLAVDGASIGFAKFITYKWKAPYFVVYFFLSLPLIFLVKKQLLSKNQIKILALWMILIIATQFASKRAISDYYFNNLVVVSLAVTSLFLSEVSKVKRSGILIGLTLIIFGFYNLYLLFSENSNDGYFYKERLVQNIKEDATKRNFACIGVNYIAGFGSGVGFRYLLWYFNLKTVKPSLEIPVYNIYIPFYNYFPQPQINYGLFGLKHPEERNYNFTKCADPSYQEQPLLGFVD
ncbi:hypothetical protein A3D07_02515 [Candidatus Curtissbacteria bacterium RIFCSPHIGHO2_02_FULL_42_15]|uniref:Uncharacterized protein n=1 Tax=Candidatus Curtissbacteria bacterium RIFCSPHIGHO2_02_FULL_42_15 TaxID=1797716 RepID=A0A1F5GDU2_9BACT|nr:MAG: hypothetical protein A3D07_02515 [Candidatus Curtissbacteria bacterium RIFCSPHIGHO2_02_FULL_42_15]